MKQKSRAGLAVFLVGVMGGAALGDHLGPQENCASYPRWCQGQCAELNACRSGNTPIGGSDCLTEEANLRFCETTPPILVVVLPTPGVSAAECARLIEGMKADRAACKKRAETRAVSCAIKAIGNGNYFEVFICARNKIQDDEVCDDDYDKLVAALPDDCQE